MDGIMMKIITAEVIESLLARAATTARKRINFNLHDDYADPINRFVNAGLCGTYVRPHRHRLEKWEIASVLQGKVDIFIFSPEGKIESRTSLSGDGTRLAEIPGGDWHTFVFRAPGAVVLEVKPGPYDPGQDKEFADWAPAEGSSAAITFIAWLETAAAGERWPGV
jgi:cupin fold WbuC family metalloprotein